MLLPSSEHKLGAELPDSFDLSMHQPVIFVGPFVEQLVESLHLHHFGELGGKLLAVLRVGSPRADDLFGKLHAVELVQVIFEEFLCIG